ncbi:DNA-methyltransferase [Archaeoglobus veneficus]|uniref:Type II methyltransferase n=1 Tax=Archaeoglobus veneficus (strain DSM 11195 / SNP6) TaxID=693661 RepID=F2KNP6_ARCVS|nr:site-specific DNA-methyltransferase [Archaeoglobus veneficus]AEA46274.1 DNA methylase N-4/N-6 domain protein [Archaeoglobus veneficus SNP6]
MLEEVEATTHKIIIGDSRKMEEVDDESVHLVVTSPPYPMIEIWDEQFRKMDSRIDDLWAKLDTIGGTSEKNRIVQKIYDLMHENLAGVWKECYRVLVDGGIACINIGDATRKVNGLFRLFPNHARVIEHCERIGFVTLPYILWKKPTTKPKYKGKGAFLGSGMLPPNAYVTLDCEFILIFRKGEPRKFPPHDPMRYASKYTKEERDRWFTQIWDIVGTRQTLPEVERRVAAFPEEIPYRLIRMFSIIGDTVLDPFVGTGTTMKVAMQLNRNSIGYEIDKNLLPVIKDKIGVSQSRLDMDFRVEIIERPTVQEFRAV